MRTEKADASPTKNFFLEMFVRDISLEDCILDLIDNSIDARIRSEGIDVSELPIGGDSRDDLLPIIKLRLSETEFSIKDNCDGIPYQQARDEVFRFGHEPGAVLGGGLGVYGVGLKRALFKIGNEVEMVSRTKESGFRVEFRVNEWAVDPNWSFPIERLDPARGVTMTGTQVTIRKLRPEVRSKIAGGAIANQLVASIAQTYTLFLNRHVQLEVNGAIVSPGELPTGSSADVRPGSETFERNDVRVKLLAGVAAKAGWSSANAGWYLLCNGRLVVAADKTELTGWGLHGAAYHDKFRGFFGIALFSSQNPLNLPWTTTKRGINRESEVYQDARQRMAALARPVLTFLGRMYPSDPEEESASRAVAAGVQPAPVVQLYKQHDGAFRVEPNSLKRRKSTIRVQYDAEQSDLERVRRALRKPAMAATNIGKHTFEYFLKRECGE